VTPCGSGPAFRLTAAVVSSRSTVYSMVTLVPPSIVTLLVLLVRADGEHIDRDAYRGRRELTTHPGIKFRPGVPAGTLPASNLQ
jgi:hypothetical protein